MCADGRDVGDPPVPGPSRVTPRRRFTDTGSQLRLRKSLELVRDTDDVLSVALAVGHSGQNHFTSGFHALFGVTPSGFRGLSRRKRAIAVSRLDAHEPMCSGRA
jgi:AraC-like DNA-binding protein